MEIGENMPSEVKMYFETKSIERLGNNIQKISTFQENQVKFYFENTRQRQYAKKYQEIKENAMKLHSVKKKYTEMFRKEKQIIERLKQAYQWVFVEDLLRLGSYLDSWMLIFKSSLTLVPTESHQTYSNCAL